MGNARQRRRKQSRKQRRRKSKQDALNKAPACDSPVGESGSMASAIPLSDDAEPLALSSTIAIASVDANEATSPRNRQTRRKARRQKAKARKRKGQLTATAVSADSAKGSMANGGDVLELSQAVQEAPKGSQLPLPEPVGEDEYLLVGESELKGETQNNTGGVARQPAASSINGAGLERLFSAAKKPVKGNASQAKSNQAKPKKGKITKGNAQEWPTTAMPPKYSSAGGAQNLAQGRALADPNERLIPKLRRWMRSLAKRNAIVATQENPPEATPHPQLDHLIGLQADLAIIQKRVDKMIDAAKG